MNPWTRILLVLAVMLSASPDVSADPIQTDREIREAWGKKGDPGPTMVEDPARHAAALQINQEEVSKRGAWNVVLGIGALVIAALAFRYVRRR